MKRGYILLSICLVLMGMITQATIDPKKEKVLILGVGKNIAHCLTTMIAKIETLGNCFSDYRVFIYENNSTDATADILEQWTLNNAKVTVISEYVSGDELHKRTQGHALRDQAPCRMELIAYARNQVLMQAMDSAYDDYSLVVMTDLDFQRGWQVDDIIASLNVTDQWDGIAANGLNGDHYHYDRYAFRDDQFPLGPELIGEEFWRIRLEQPIYFLPGTPLRKVYSAFGGVAIYKRESLRDCYYTGFVTQDLEWLMQEIINNKMSTDHQFYQCYRNAIGNRPAPLPIIFIPNCGYDSPVVCEHSTLHASMIKKGHDKLFVNPNLICRY
ncbi:hypothetical protein Noda2021_07460 [Candidatus Dependentiae bacterium Noda2021]|nr:hypothetical protein Noda2021_07460 [Candidatus Dependentiae bacterium Noda2021]